ncbi:beta-ketoacyl synthase N-terminal-like domain-containing protein [Bacillus cereus]|uniref:beta-ketoacyl synthase N-terminal-like domain-containing protein n=1 Tax=Bacillus cereus TaxID=1396 RepID=UPI0012FAAA4F|nr:beta-ketoacyl synthase N-terminal-like domain-containing protein [Bacillus cereus]
MPYDYSMKFRDISRCANNGVNAAELAWKDAFSENEEINLERWGVSVGTAFGGFPETQKIQCDAFIENGPIGISPGLSIHSGFHLTGDIVAINQGLRGPNTTFTSGRLASAMALLQAYDDVKYGLIDGNIVVGTESIDDYLVRGHQLFQEVPSLNFSDGACALVLRESCNQVEDKDRIFIRTITYSAHAGKLGRYSHHVSKSLVEAIEQALTEVNLSRDDIGHVISMEGQSTLESKYYKRALSKIWDRNIQRLCITRPRQVLGDMFGANAIMGVGIGWLYMQNQPMDNVLIVADDPTGIAWATVLQRGGK